LVGSYINQLALQEITLSFEPIEYLIVQMEQKLKDKMKTLQIKQRKMGKKLIKEIKNDPPSTHKKSLVSWSDSLTIKFLEELKKKPDLKGKNAVETF
jgi:hypothetical protein